MDGLLELEYYNNTVLDYIIAAGIIIIGWSILRLFRKTLLTRLQDWSTKTSSNIDNYVVIGVKRFGLPILNFIILYAGINYLELSDKAARVIQIAVAVVITYFALRLISSTALVLLQTYVRRQENGEDKVKQLGGIMLIFNMVLWMLGFLFLIDNLGYNVTTIIAGLGIGGIAVALAAQNILGDLFNYFVIFFDRPFEIGDFINVDDKSGNVEYIGIKTTRVKTLSGEQLIISNSDLTQSRVHNYKRMQTRRIVFTIGLVYQTQVERLKEIPGILRQAVESQKDVTFDRAHFSKFSDSSLDFEVVYIVQSADFNKYMDIQQNINLYLFEEFEKRGIEFAYPTRTLNIERSAKIKEEPDKKVMETFKN
jgi:small-conductance mechanosensitive channel